MLQLKKAQRQRAKLKLGISSPSGGGKTLGSLLIAYGLMKETYPKISDQEIWEKIAIIDTENKSGELYVGKEICNMVIGEYGAIELGAPFTAEKYIKAINLCVESNIEVIIIDSTTHLWAGTGGLLQQQGDITKRTGNSWSAWRDITPMHANFIETMLQSDVHIIATVRSKTKHIQEKNSNGKTIVRKVGLDPIQKDGFTYEFTTFIEIDAEHNAFGSKDRTGVVDQKYFVIDKTTGQDFMKWLKGGTSKPVQIIALGKASPEEARKVIKEKQDEIVNLCIELGGRENKELMAILEPVEPSGNPNKIKNIEILNKLCNDIKTLKGE